MILIPKNGSKTAVLEVDWLLLNEDVAKSELRMGKDSFDLNIFKILNS